MSLHDYFRIFRKNWLAIVGITALSVAVAALVSILATPKFVSSLQLFVSVRSLENSTTVDLVQGSSAAQQKVQSYVDVVTSSRVLSPVVNQLRLSETPKELAQSVTAESPLNTVLINITVQDALPERAARIANAIGVSFTDVVVNSLESPQDGGPSLVKIETTEPAAAPTSPSSPRTDINLIFGLLVGLLLGIGAAVLRSALDTRIRGSHDIEMVTDTSILGGITFDPTAKKRPLTVHLEPRTPKAELYRSLRTNLQFVNFGSTSRCFVITSSVPGEGKTVTTSNLGIALAETGSRVVIIDGDLRLPRIATMMGLEGIVGLTDVLIGRAELHDVLQPWGRGQLHILPAGRVPPNPSELLGSAAMVSLLDSLTQTFDYVLIDAPPLLPVTDAAVLSKLAAGTIVISASGRTTRSQLQAALGRLEHIGARVAGIVMTMLPPKGPDASGYGNYGTYHGVVASDDPSLAAVGVSASSSLPGATG